MFKQVKELQKQIEKQNEDMTNMQLEFMKILAIAINKLQGNDLTSSELKNKATLKYLKSQYEIIQQDIAIQNDEECKIIELSDKTGNRYR